MQQRTTKVIWAMGPVSYEEMLRALGCFSPAKKRRLRGSLIEASNCLKRSYNDYGPELLLVTDLKNEGQLSQAAAWEVKTGH